MASFFQCDNLPHVQIFFSVLQIESRNRYEAHALWKNNFTKEGEMKMATSKGAGNHLALFFRWSLVLLLAAGLGCAAVEKKGAGQAPAAASGQVASQAPMEIPADVSCGKCGMFPANYPRWQSQIIFKDGSMTSFDGCKCMFNFLMAMDNFDKTHSADDVLVVWVKDFDSGAWINAVDAHYVVGSDMMGPMGKELIPFADSGAARKFHQESGGVMMQYADITPEVLKGMGMGGMKMKHGTKQMQM
jgi:nitrous oxide reductase accessory protein NosL